MMRLSLLLLPLTMLFPTLSLAYEGEAAPVPDPAEGFRHLWREVLTDITIFGVVFSIITLYLLVRYRRKHPDAEGKPPRLTYTQVLGWALIPVFVFMADDFFLAAKGWTLWNNYRTPPEGSFEVSLESSMWMWNFKYPGGVETFNELRVPAGKPVLVRMKSKDVVHSMFIPDFKVKEDSMPGRITYLWFYPKEPGEHVLTCAEYCGVLHSGMAGKLIAMPEKEFYNWLEEEMMKKGGA